MQLGEIIANFFAALLMLCVLSMVFLLAGKPLWPEEGKARMVLLLPPDAITTASIKAPTHPHLPESIDAGLLQPKPPH
ncbi:polymerase [Mesorhizobium sp. M3A.F.Ca.ET.174.01.1.1]|uniref:polymerase n=2 Tax=Mesorhizobium TaxID=68287 RepID=UPI00109364DA|nr:MULTISPECIES: polymerase [unclassified Mesorhizobium]TGS71488.1 polymerase [Mesorhizobium sp. M3A.F.Ca.ET.201.01.1.1]TGS82101.1 polymerase [Mesorhizobium sp. M3A.F.Ca.ET.175.01.1.1]TGT21963.1 polymerase [Mesorhizobium sp. M3A.F.Ca.ET.174.01.1.1]